MWKTTATWEQIRNDSLTWADINDWYGLYDETDNYSIWQIVLWRTKKYKAIAAVTGWAEWDFSNAPDVSANWESIDSIMYTVHPSASQNLTTSKTDITFDTEEWASASLSIASNEITCLKSCTVFVALTMSADITSWWTRSETRYNLQLDTGSWYSDIDNTEIILYHRTVWAWWNTGTIIKPLFLNVWDKIKAQWLISTWSNIATSIDWCAINIRTPASWKWDKWDKWDTWASWDMIWVWPFTSWVTTANINEVYEFQWQSFVCRTNWTTSDPDAVSPDWDLVAKKWADGAWASININSDGSAIPNTPHSTLNFKWDVTVTDAWGWVADIEVAKNTYMLPIRAEENWTLSSWAYEWAFGNGAQTPNDWGVTIYVPTWYTAKIVAMSLRLWSWTATVEAVVNWTLQWNLCDVTVSSWQWATNDSFAPVSVSSWDYVNFRTTTASWTSQPNVVTMWIEYTKA